MVRTMLVSSRRIGRVVAPARSPYPPSRARCIESDRTTELAAVNVSKATHNTGTFKPHFFDDFDYFAWI